MKYREFGNTGYRISALGFGAMRLPKKEEGGLDIDRSVQIMRRAAELGVNFYDTAMVYNKGQSETAVGEALCDMREDVFISSKIPLHHSDINNGGDVRKGIEAQLQRLNTDYIDFWNFHDLKYEHYKQEVEEDKNGILKAVQRAKEEGMIRHICLSCHAPPKEMLEMLGSGLFEGIILQYNLMSRRNEEVIDYAHKNGIGVVAMGPVGGGQLALPSRRLAELKPQYVDSLPELAIRYVLSNPGVACTISGMNSVEMVEENCAAAAGDSPLTGQERDYISKTVDHLHELAKLYCTGCSYCMPCPHGVHIAKNFKLMNLYRVYGFEEAARKAYAAMPEEGSEDGKLRASACRECGECVDKCPQDIDIPANLNEVAEVLGG